MPTVPIAALERAPSRPTVEAAIDAIGAVAAEESRTVTPVDDAVGSQKPVPPRISQTSSPDARFLPGLGWHIRSTHRRSIFDG
jgi:hypothetical protein